MALRIRLRRPAGPATPTPDTGTSPPGDATTSGAAGPARTASRTRRVAGVVLTGLATLLVVAALLTPDRLADVGPGAVLRIPVEGLVAVALLLVLPARARRPAALALGAVLGLLTVVKLLDTGFRVARDRPFDVLLDWGLFDDGFGYLTDSAGRAAAVAAAVGVLLLVAGLPVLLALAVRRLARLLARHRTGAVRVVAALAVLWLGCALFGVRLAAGVPVADRSATGRGAAPAGPGRGGSVV
ncbi:sulfatase, partial [Micromonospora chersina]